MSKKEANTKFSFKTEPLHKALTKYYDFAWNDYSRVLFVLYRYKHIFSEAIKDYLLGLTNKELFNEVLVPCLFAVYLNKSDSVCLEPEKLYSTMELILLNNLSIKKELAQQLKN
jgi:hypothetical protein